MHTVEVDSALAPLITAAFKHFATGEVSLAQLAARLRQQGLRRPGRPARPASPAAIGQLLRNRWYAGFVDFKGRAYVGKHQPLIDFDTYVSVQELLRTTTKQRQHKTTTPTRAKAP